MSARAKRRVVVTSIGVVAPNGRGREAYWSATLRGTSGIARITRFDPSEYSAQLAGQSDLDSSVRLPGRLLPQTDRMTRLALVAAEEALEEAGVDPKKMPPYATGVVTAASAGGTEFAQREHEAMYSKGGAYVSAYHSFAWFYPVNSGQISIRHGMRGPGGALVADQAGGLDAIGKSRQHVRDGTPLMLTGGVDGSLCPWAWVCLQSTGQISIQTDPQRAFVPFDSDACGYVPGEGGALIVLEDEMSAKERRVGRIYGEVAGYAATFDARPGVNAVPGIRRAIELALADAEATPAEVDVVFADASGLPEPDMTEAHALSTVFGPRGVPVTAPKTMTGRLSAGGGPLDVAAALLAMRDSVIPPTVHVSSPAYADVIDLVRDEPRAKQLRCALVVARGYGGFNSAMVLRGVA